MFLKNLNLGVRNISGRSSSLGRLTVFHRGGSGVKRKFRLINLSRGLYDIFGTVVLAGEYDPNRSAFISLICYDNGVLAFILAPSGLKGGASIVTFAGSPTRTVEIGDSARLRYFPVGCLTFCVSMYGSNRGRIARAAGTACLVLKKFHDRAYVLLKLPSGTHYMVHEDSFGTNGYASNSGHRFYDLPSAGCRRRLGFRPVVRGVAMNPVDHPHGGGEGKSGGGRPSVTPWGFVTKGPRTRSSKHKVSFIVVPSVPRNKRHAKVKRRR